MFRLIRSRLAVKYLVVTTVTIAAVFTGLFVWLSHQQRQHILRQVEKQAIILHKQIVVTRQWASDHNTILVSGDGEARDGYVYSAPALNDVNGMVFTRMTPAALTRRLSNYAARSRLYSFNLTNINGKNPDNEPDLFEKEAIEKFRRGMADSLSKIERVDGKAVFRFAAPLTVRESCLSCHQNYSVGSVGGCISVLIPFDDAQKAMKLENIRLLAAMAGLTATVILVLFLFSRLLIFKPIQDIRKVTRRIRAEAFNGDSEKMGDELREFADVCYFMDHKLRSHHAELEREIETATADLHRTNNQLAEVNRQLSQLNQAKLDFFSDISHELRTPLTAVKGAADFLSRKASCSDPTHVAIIRKNTDHLIQTITDFLDYSRIESGNLELEKAETNLAELVRNAATAQEALAQAKSLSLSLQTRADVRMAVDRRRIFQVLANLITNAIRFSPDAGVIEIGLQPDDGGAKIWVKDNGPGIAPAYHEAIFKKFFQVTRQPGIGELHKGSAGIGLAICRGLVEAHDGRIWVESRKGEGSRFVFTLSGRDGR